MSPAVPKTQAEWRTAYEALYDQKITAEQTTKAIAAEMDAMRVRKEVEIADLLRQKLEWRNLTDDTQITLVKQLDEARAEIAKLKLLLRQATGRPRRRLKR